MDRKAEEKKLQQQRPDDNIYKQITRQRSKSEIETVHELASPTHFNKPIGSGPLSPSRSMKSIVQPY